MRKVATKSVANDPRFADPLPRAMDNVPTMQCSVFVYLLTLPGAIGSILSVRPRGVIGPMEVTCHEGLTEVGRTGPSRVKRLQPPVIPLASTCDRVVRLCGEPRLRMRTGREDSSVAVA